MTDYRPPVDEMKFIAYDVLNYQQLNSIPQFAEVNTELVNAVLEEGGKFAADVFAPLNRLGDITGSKAVKGAVTTPKGFKEAYQLFVDNGWLGLAQSPDYGGQGLPFTVHMMVSEFWNSANMSMAICPMLSAGAIDVLMAHGNDDLKKAYLEKMISGQWSGTMNLTEPHAGSDLSKLKTKATPKGDHYLIKGQKVFITWGEHDMTENIIHIVLAPTIDAPTGVKGLSLFLVPKFIPDADGSVGQRNDLKVVSIEHKLGINASPTCVMQFGENDGAVGYMIGEPGQGLECMFTLMNHARLEVGLEGLGLSERAYQDAIAYARERMQGRNAESGEPAAIIEHADVQRMLMQMKSMIDAMRGLCLDTSISHDLRIHAQTKEERSDHQTRFALLTPITKGWCTELVNEVTSLGVQVHGGMGYIEETGVAQYYRDARITAIYEGTNGIQANDLVGRKLVRDGGAGFNALMDEMQTVIIPDAGALKTQHDIYRDALTELKSTAEYILANGNKNAFFEGAIAFNFLMQFGYVIGAWYHLRSMEIARDRLAKGEGDADFYRHKVLAAKFYIGQMLPRAHAHSKAVINGADVGTELSAEAFL